MANPARLEITFRFGGKDYTVKPTFEVIAGIEAVTGKTCFKLADMCYGNTPDEYPSLLTTSQIVYQVLRSVDDKIAPVDVSNTLMEEGASHLWQPLGNFLGRAFRGNATHIKMAEQEARAGDAPADPPIPPSTSNGG